MKYTLAQNAIGSLSIAIDNFKKFYYSEEKYSQSEQNEAIKICIVFLENAIELMLKDILVSIDPMSIYKCPNSRSIKSALSKVTDSLKLEDVLISEGKFQTITYTDTIKKYNELFYKSQKVYQVLNSLGEKRNAIMHFGLDESDNLEELTIGIIDVFDVIYNYLYPQLINLDEIDIYFKSDDWIVDTVHGKKFLFDDHFIYNNILDFLDELLEDSKDDICAMRSLNIRSKIWEFRDVMKVFLNDKKYDEMKKDYQLDICFATCNFDENKYVFEITKDSECLNNIFSCYSPFFNVTGFCGEYGEIYFVVVHDEHNLYIYKDDNVIWPQHDEKEPDYQWIKDYNNGICEKYNLSKRNLLVAFMNILQKIQV